MKSRQTWQAKVREVYSSLEELCAFDGVYDIAKRCGYVNAAQLWKSNPKIGGSVDPAAFGRAHKHV